MIEVNPQNRDEVIKAAMACFMARRTAQKAYGELWIMVVPHLWTPENGHTTDTAIAHVQRELSKIVRKRIDDLKGRIIQINTEMRDLADML